MLNIVTVGTRELQRLDVGSYDIVEIVDRKKNELKGLFVSAKYAEETKKHLIESERKKKSRLLGFAGMIKDESKRVSQIREEM